MTRSVLRPTLFLALGAAALAAGPAHATLRVVATLPDLAAIASEVGGDKVQVTALADPAEDPHYVDPKPSLLIPLSRADLLIVNGLELEVGWLPPLQASARNAAIRTGGPGYLDASVGVRLMEVPQTRIDRSQGDIHPGGNPHYMHDPRAAIVVAKAIAARLATLDPPNASFYAERAQAFVREAQAVVDAERARFAALPSAKRRVIGYHRSLTYLEDWLGLTEEATIEPLPGIAPSPGHVAEVLATMRETGARVIVQEEYYRRNTSETLARMARSEMVILHGGTRFAKGERYLDHIRHTAQEIHDALSH
ncbi:MAG: zinc ABC transporter substrate-binding protein [Deltaproteobacteria bacterium]|nr:zinc ABC transporter substrate-binding protein [Deltaproteobacteria bacterium]MCB9789185.1 zinc ABC transporter substrate-binding protein [Deltaproteobacteria bacterium]